MMFTLLYPILLLDSWTNALPQTPYKISHFQQQQAQPGTTIVTINDVPNEPKERSSSSGTGVEIIISRQTRQIPRDWLYPTFNPPSSYNSNRRSSSSSSGLAYRSIIPQSSDHYTQYYRNRNLYTGRRKQQHEPDSWASKNDNNLGDPRPPRPINASPNSRGGGGLPSSPGPERNYNDIVNSNYHNPDLTISSSQTPSTSTTSDAKTTTTTVKVPSSLDTSETSVSHQGESVVTTPEPRSAPATDPFPTARLSSTLQMEIKDDNDPDVIIGEDVSARDAIGTGVPDLEGSGVTSPGNANAHHEREAKARIVEPVVALLSPNAEEQDSMIIFPGNVSRSSSSGKNPKQRRPGKSSLSDDESYVPPPLKTLDRAALQSLRRLIEARKRAVAMNARNPTGTSGINNSNDWNKVPQSSSSSLNTKSLEINRPPSCASESGYCEAIDTYPKDFLNQVLKKSVSPDVFQEVFGDSIENNTVATDLIGRNDLQDTPLCNSIEHTIYPQVAKNREGKFMYVVNHDDYVQSVRVEKCVGENNQCMFPEGNPTGYQSTCRQKFMYKKLLAFSPEGKAMTDTFRLPSCCVCYLRSAFVGDRINAAGLLNSNSNGDKDHDHDSLSSDADAILLPKNSANEPILNDDKNLSASNSTKINSSELNSTNSSDMITFAGTTLSSLSADEAESLSQIVHDAHFMDGLQSDELSTRVSNNDTMSEIITTGPFFRSF